MDYYSLKRRELQALCMKHNIPANSANSVLADELSKLLNEKLKPKARKRTCMKSLVETTDEGEPVEVKRQAKKVRFSPNNDLVEYKLRPGEKQKEMVTQIKTRRKSVAKKVDKSVDDDNNTVELNEESAQVPVKVTRSRVQSSVNDAGIPNDGKKKGRRGARDVVKGTDIDKETEGNVGKVTRSRAHTLQKGGSVQREENKQSKRVVKEEIETVVARVRVTRSKAQNLMEGGTGSDANPRSKEVKTEVQDVEPSKEVMEFSVRATRSRRQTIKEDIENTVTNNTQADKKRTRREMKATDSSHVAPVDKQEPPKRKSLRTRGVETMNEDEGDKMEVVNKSRVTRSRAPLAKEASGRNSRNKNSKVEIQQPEESLKPADKKNVNRRKTVLQPEKTKADPHLEEPVNHPARKNTRRKSVVQKAAKTVVSPTVREKQSKGLSGDIENKENVTRSGKDSSANNLEEVTAVTPTSRKRRGTPVIEDQIIVDKSQRSSTRSGSKSEEKSVAKKQVESSLKKPMSKGKNSAIRSGAIIRESTFKKRAKLSGTKQSDSEDKAVNSSKEWTPVAKMRNLKLDEEVTEPVVTPTIDKSGRRFTRSTMKEQPTAEAELFSPNVAKFRHDPAVNTAPGRITRRGIIHDGNAAGSFSEKVGKKKQTRQLAHKKPLDDAEVASPEVAEVGPTPDVGANGVQSEVKQPLDEVQLSSPEVAEVMPTPDVGTIGLQFETKQPLDEVQLSSPEVAVVGPTPDVGTIETQSEIKQSPDEVQLSSSPEVAEVLPNPDVDSVGVQSETKQPLDEVQLSSPEVAEVRPDEDVDTIGVQSEIEQPCDDVQMCTPEVAEVQPNSDSDTVGVGSEVSKEVTGQTLGDSSASESVRLPTEVVDENIVFVEVMEDAGDCNEKPTHETSATRCLTENLLSGKQQNPLESQSFDAGTPSAKNVSHFKMIPVSMADVAETVPVQSQNEEVYVESGIFSEAVKLETSVLKSERPDATEKETELTELGSTLKGMQTDVMIEQPLVSIRQTVVVEEGVDNNCDPSLRISSVDEHDVADDGERYDEDESASAQKPLISEPDSEDIGVADEVDVQENLVSGNEIYGKCDNAISDRKSHLDMFGTPLIGKGDVEDDDINVPNELETDSELSNANKSTDIDIGRGLEDNINVQDGESEHDQLTSDDHHATDEEDVGGDDSEPAQNESMPVLAEVLVTSCDHEPEQSLNVAVEDVPCDSVGQSVSVTSEDAPEDDMVARVDAQEDSVVEIRKDVISSILGDTYDMDAEGDGGNDQMLTEFEVGFQPSESRDISSDMSNEQAKEVAETNKGNDHTLVDQKQAAATDDDLDSDKFMEDGSHIKTHEDPTREEASPILYTKGQSTVDGIDSSHLMGDIGAHECLITKERSPITYKKEESPVDDADSDSPTIKGDDRNKQDETRSAGTSVDWDDFEMDEFEKPVSANGSADVEGKGKQGNRDSDLQSSGLAAGLTNSVRKLDKGSRSGLDGNSNQEVDMLKESANAADMTQVFNWSDSSLKSLVTTSATSTTRHVNDFDGETTQDNAVRGSESEIYGVPSFEDNPLKLFEDEEVGGSFDRLESNTHYEFKQFEFLNEATGKSHHDLSGLKDKSTRELEKKEDTRMKGSKVDDYLAFDTGK